MKRAASKRFPLTNESERGFKTRALKLLDFADDAKNQGYADSARDYLVEAVTNALLDVADRLQEQNELQEYWHEELYKLHSGGGK